MPISPVIPRGCFLALRLNRHCSVFRGPATSQLGCLSIYPQQPNCGLDRELMNWRSARSVWGSSKVCV